MSNVFKVKISTIDNVKTFSRICEGFNYDIDVYAGRYIVDGRSILGILSFDLTKVLNVKINTDDEEVIEKFSDAIKEFKNDDD
jgi:phosphotransferase system HPr-like phosphotransfer protein